MRNNKIKNNTKYQIHVIENDQPIKDFEFIQLNTFLKKIKKSSVSEVIAHDLLDYTADVEKLEILEKINDKIINGGKIYIQGTDSKLLSHAYVYGQIDHQIFKAMIFGSGKRSVLSIDELKKIINQIQNLSIVQIKFINAVQYYVECEKNG